MYISDEAIALYYISNDGQHINAFDVGEKFKITRVNDIPQRKYAKSISITNIFNNTRQMTRAISKDVIKDDNVDMMEKMKGKMVTITPDLLDQVFLHIKFMEI